MTTAYYNEIDPKAAAWLRELIKQGHIAPGDVDERSIEDVTPNELSGYTQCHFFAGVGVWSYALRLSGWPDDRPAWTGSCPCQPFSAAGKGGGFADERHLWPSFFWLIKQRSPDVVFGEQVASKDGRTWLDLVSTDMEGEGYAIGPAATVACGFGAPHKRQRSFWVADSMSRRQQDGSAHVRSSGQMVQRPGERRESADNSGPGQLANTDRERFAERSQQNSKAVRPKQPASRRGNAGRCVDASSMADPEGGGRSRRSGADGQDGQETSDHCGSGSVANAEQRGREGGAIGQGKQKAELATKDLLEGAAGPTNGHWRDVDWLFCRDGKWRPVEPGTFPLANGAPARVGNLRGFGNAIVAQQAQAFIESYQEYSLSGATERRGA